ncbi:MAG: hypothetical protein NXY59_06860 [Aigarchaeota archaeon]|nr:hypothetical protein [Candidatus Pelearchaeum maunauluense]
MSTAKRAPARPQKAPEIVNMPHLYLATETPMKYVLSGFSQIHLRASPRGELTINQVATSVKRSQKAM